MAQLKKVANLKIASLKAASLSLKAANFNSVEHAKLLTQLDCAGLRLMPLRIPTIAIRQSLTASTLDGVFAVIFANLTGGVLLSNFLVNLRVSPWEVGILAAIPLMANVIQPLGAWLSDRFSSRHNYCVSVYFPARLVWIVLLVGIGLFQADRLDAHGMVLWTMVVMLSSHLLGGLGSAAWLSWMAVLVPRRLRGTYFGIRNSAANLASLVVVPIAGLGVANYPRGELEGFAIALSIGILAGGLSLAFQWRMVDVNPQGQLPAPPADHCLMPATVDRLQPDAGLQLNLPVPMRSVVPSFGEIVRHDRNFQQFLLYSGLSMFAVNLSAPFFNLYLLQDLSVDVSWVTLYNSLSAGANLLLLIPFGRLADKIGNRIPLLSMGLVVALLPLLWLSIDAGMMSLWLWLPLLYLLHGVAMAAIELCLNNLQLEISHPDHQAKYFGITAAIVGVSGAIGTLVGGSLAQLTDLGGLSGVFLLSSGVRLVALLPLLLIQESRGWSLLALLNWKPAAVTIPDR